MDDKFIAAYPMMDNKSLAARYGVSLATVQR